MCSYWQVFLLFFVLFGSFLNAEAQQGWFTPEVATAIGIETCAKCPAPEYRTKTYRVGNNAVYAKTLAFFDTIATYAQGRVVDKRTHKSIAGARILIRYCSAFRTEVETKTATTDKDGIFNMGWVGHNGTTGLQSNRLILVDASSYESISTTAVAFGAAAYLHIELIPFRNPK